MFYDERKKDLFMKIFFCLLVIFLKIDFFGLSDFFDWLMYRGVIVFFIFSFFLLGLFCIVRDVY